MSNKRLRISTETIKFNIGGERYEVSRDMLETNYPNTMLTCISSEKWREDPEAEIFIEGDGKIFQYVLSYLHDNKVFLPITASKEMVMNELSYYGVDFEETNIHEKALIDATLFVTAQNALKELEEKSTTLAKESMDLKIQSVSLKVAADVIKSFLLETKDNTCISMKDEENLRNLYTMLDNETTIMKVNSHLEMYGLKVKHIMWNYRIKVYKVQMVIVSGSSRPAILAEKFQNEEFIRKF